MFKIQHPLIEDKNVSYGFFTRNGGFSKQPFNTLNCSQIINDDKINVEKNLSLVKKELGLKNIIKLHQVHSSDVIIIDKKNDKDKIIGRSLSILKRTMGINSLSGIPCSTLS